MIYNKTPNIKFQIAKNTNADKTGKVTTLIARLITQMIFITLLVVCFPFCVFSDDSAKTMLPLSITLPTAIKLPIEHPFLLYTKSEIDAWKKDNSRSSEIKSVMQKAENILKKGLWLIEREGDWIFYYECPSCHGLTEPESESNIDAQVCKRCSKTFHDAKITGGYITHVNYQLDNELLDLATAYALTDKREFAEPVKNIMLKLVELYPKLERHDRWGRRGLLAVVGGRRYAQHLDEAYSMIILARAYDLIFNALSDSERVKISNGLFRFVIDEIVFYSKMGVVGGRNNHQTWFNAAYANAGVAIGDETYVREALYGKHGLEWQLSHSVTSDGLWYEGAIDYHHYALQAIMSTLDAVQRAEINFKDNEGLKKLWSGPIQIAYPDGSIPAMNDSNPSGLGNLQGMYKWGYKYFGDELFASYAGMANSLQRIQPESAVLEDIGIAVLRRGAGEKTVCAMLDYGIHGGAHGHPDKLNLVFYALGRQFLVDPGRISYSVPEFEKWCRKTVAHNTVVVNQRDQTPSDGKLIFFRKENGYTACLADAGNAYPGMKMKRFLLLTDEILIDVFSVQCGEKDTVDWLCHSYGDITLPSDSSVVTQPIGDKNGYEYLKKVVKVNVGQNAHFDFYVNNAKFMRVNILGDGSSQVFSGKGIGVYLGEEVPFVLIRRTGPTTFFTVYDLTGEGKGLSSPEVVVGSKECVGLKFTDSAGKQILCTVDFEASAGGAECEGMKFTGMYFSSVSEK